MGRKRAQRPVPVQSLERAEDAGPVGSTRVAWSQLAGLLAALVTGLGFALSDVVQAARCDTDDVTCTLGVYLAGTLLSALAGVAVMARVFRLGWEWALVCATIIVAMPLLLDLLGNGAWAAAVLAPTLAALATFNGRRGSRRRPVVVVACSAVAIAAALWWTFLPGA